MAVAMFTQKTSEIIKYSCRQCESLALQSVQKVFAIPELLLVRREPPKCMSPLHSTITETPLLSATSITTVRLNISTKDPKPIAVLNPRTVLDIHSIFLAHFLLTER